MAHQLAWIGLGNMGRGMVKNLVEKGNLSAPLILYNRTKKRADDLSAQLEPGKTKIVSSIDDAVSTADVVFISLGDDKAVVESINSIMKQNVKSKLFVDCSTVHPDTTNALGKTITGNGARFVASPVFGPPAMADAGQLLFLLTGPRSDIDIVKPFTKGVMGRGDIELPDQEYGKSALLKLTGNSMILHMIESLSEAHTLAEKSGLGTENLHTLIEAMFPGNYVGYSNRMLQGDYHKREEPLFQVDLARKDIGHVLGIAGKCGTKMKAVDVANQHLQDVKDHAGTKGDVAGIYGAVRMESGLKYEN